MSEIFFSIVIPLHNESESLPILMGEIDEVLSSSNHIFEVIFVNDQSTDNTESLLEEIEKKYTYVKAISLEKRGGQTGCYQAAFALAKGNYIIRMDGDLQDDPKDLVKFIPLLEEGVDLVMGLRQVRSHRKLLRLAGLVYDALVIILFNSPLYTNTSSFIAIKSDFIQNIKFVKNDHRYLTLIAMRRGAKKLREVVVVNRTRKYGKSKYGAYKKIIFGLPEVLRLFWRVKYGYYDPKN